MALRDQPYIPLYVQDYLTDEKLNACKSSTQGIYIKLMCIFHKSENYGGILLKQKDKQNKNTCFDFALKLSKLLTFTSSEIHDALIELLDEEVLYIDGDFLYQKRMVRDNDISCKRSKSGKKGGDKSLGKDKNLLKQKHKQKPEYEDEDEYKSSLDNIIDNNTIYAFENFWNDYDKKVGDKKKIEKKFNLLKDDDKLKIKEHIPKYTAAQPDKQFRKDPQTYLNNKSWNDEIIQRNGNNNFQSPTANGNSNNGQNSFRTDAQRRADSRDNLKELSIRILQQP